MTLSVAPFSENTSEKVVAKSLATDTIQVGQGLWIILLTATLVDSKNPLKGDGTTYTYDILQNNKTIFDVDTLKKISHEKYSLPSFVLPHDDLNKMRIIHGSCRKPHGGRGNDPDMLAYLDTLIEDSIQDTNSNVRPQQLFLTGDQIYADDVSFLLLEMIMDASNVLIGISENDIFGQDQVLPSPRNRLKKAKEIGLTAGDVANSHLFTLGEYYCMYLFVWSDVLWDDGFPEFKVIFPGKNETFTQYYVLDDKLQEDIRDTPEKIQYDEQINKLSNFKNKLGQVRRVFANISTYMTFDDHDVTDDWNLNRPWIESGKIVLINYNNNGKAKITNEYYTGTYGNVGGKRLVSNALSAYALFQHWGNMGEEFPKTLKEALQYSSYKLDSSQFFSTIKQKILPTYHKSENGKEAFLSGSTEIKWHYVIEFNHYVLISLDTRTQRLLRNQGPGLLSEDAIEAQIADVFKPEFRQKKFTLMVSPAPLIALWILDFVKEKLTELGSNYIEKLTKRGADYEEWKNEYNRDVFESFLNSLLAYNRIVLLSGDIHYAYSTSMNYFAKEGMYKSARIINLVSSSLKNSDTMTKIVEEEYNRNLASLALSLLSSIFEINPKLAVKLFGKGVSIASTYIYFNVSNSFVSHFLGLKNNNIRFETQKLKKQYDGKILENSEYTWEDLHLPDEKWPYVYNVELIKNLGPNLRWKKIGDRPDWEYSTFLHYANDKVKPEPGKEHELPLVRSCVVGSTNIGDITFKVDNNWEGNLTAKANLIHKLWYSSTNKYDCTAHNIDLHVLPDVDDFRPSILLDLISNKDGE